MHWFSIAYIFLNFKLKLKAWKVMKEVRYYAWLKKHHACNVQIEFKNTSTKISIPNHISSDEEHVWQLQSHYKQQTFVLLNHGKNYIKKKMMFLVSRIKVNKVFIAIQVSEPSSCDIQAFIKNYITTFPSN